MFGMANTPGLGGVFGNLGPQVRGFGMLHDGSIDTLARFLSSAVFSLNATEEANLTAFVMAFDSDLPPIVGQQITRNSTNGAVVDGRITLMINSASAAYPSKLLGPGARMCDVVAKGVVGGIERGYVLDTGLNSFVPDRAAEAPLSDAALRALANTAGQEITYTCVPFGSGVRMGIDRDLDTFRDRDEIDAGSDPADAGSVPGGVPVLGKKLIIKDRLPDDESKRKVIVLMKDAAVAAPAPGGADDPRCNGDASGTVKATLVVSSVQSAQSHTTDLPCQNWQLLGSAANPKGYKYKDSELDDGTAKIVVWKDGSQVKAILQGKGPSLLSYDLQLGLPQGTVSAVLTSGAVQLCTTCPAFNGKDGSDGRKFLGKSCAAPVSCP
jgi:hypothetical protein